MSEIEIACSCEGAYVPHSAAMMHSVLAASDGEAVRFHYLHSPRLAERDARRLVEMVERDGGAIQLHEIADERVAELPVWSYFTHAMWYRLLLPELLPELDRIIYLDLDTIAAGSLAPLWETKLGDAYVAAVTNVFQADHRGRVERLGLREADYFNSGVLVLNLEAIRRDDRAAELRRFAMESPDGVAWPDQDALNVVLGEGRVGLHPRWNLMNAVLAFPDATDIFGEVAIAEARRDPGIRHFEGPGENKPWHLLCEQPMRELYRAARRETPWRWYLPEGVSAANLATRVRRGR